MDNGKLTPGPWLDFHDKSEHASGVIRLKNADGWHDASEEDCALMMLAPELLDIARGILVEDMIQYLPEEYVAKVRAVMSKVPGCEVNG